MKKQHLVNLTDGEREELTELLRNGSESAKRHTLATILLKADAKEGGLSDEEIANESGVSAKTVYRLRKKYSEGGLEQVFAKRMTPRLSRRKFSGESEAQLVKLCCSEAPEGHARWTLQLLADKVVELEIVEEVSRSAIYQTLKKMNLSPG